MTRDRLAWAGWGLSLLSVPVSVDIIAFATGRESMSCEDCGHEITVEGAPLGHPRHSVCPFGCDYRPTPPPPPRPGPEA